MIRQVEEPPIHGKVTRVIAQGHRSNRCVASAILALLVYLALSLRPLQSSPPAGALIPPSVTGIEVTASGASVEMDLVKQAGAGWTRIAGVWWPDVEPVEGQLHWESLKWLDDELLAARSNDLTVVLVVRGTPAWAQRFQGFSCGPILKSKLSSFASFVAALVGRYSREPYDVQYYEMGNEPDIDRKLVQPDSLWGCWGDETDPYYGGEAYAAVLQAVYPRIKQANHTAQVLVGGLALDCDPRPGGGCPTEQRRRPARFLEGVLRAGGGRYFDGISFHSYDYYDSAVGHYSNKNFYASSSGTGPVSIQKAAYLRSLLNAYAVTGKYLLNTESAVLCRTCVNDADYEKTKAYYVAQANAAALAIDLRANIWFRLSNWPDTALVQGNASMQPAYTAHLAFAQELDGAHYQRVLSESDTGDRDVRGYVFQRNEQDIWIVWSVDALTHTLTLPSTPLAAADVLGQPVQLNGRHLTLAAPDLLLAYIEW